jgi:hypothetical protein
LLDNIKLKFQFTHDRFRISLQDQTKGELEFDDYPSHTLPNPCDKAAVVKYAAGGRVKLTDIESKELLHRWKDEIMPLYYARKPVKSTIKLLPDNTKPWDPKVEEEGEEADKYSVAVFDYAEVEIYPALCMISISRFRHQTGGNQYDNRYEKSACVEIREINKLTNFIDSVNSMSNVLFNY